MEQYTKDIVRMLLDKKVSQITQEKDKEINDLKNKLKMFELEKELEQEHKNKPTEESIDVDKILGGLYE